jgi:hypothetical protein
MQCGLEVMAALVLAGSCDTTLRTPTFSYNACNSSIPRTLGISTLFTGWLGARPGITIPAVEFFAAPGSALRVRRRPRPIPKQQQQQSLSNKGEIMDDQQNADAGKGFGDGNSAAGTAARLKQQIADKAADVRDRVTDFSRQAADKLDASRQPAADQLNRAASNLHSQSERIAGQAHEATDRFANTARSSADRFASQAHSTTNRVAGAAHAGADTLQGAASYLRDHDFSQMADDVTDLVKRYPGQSLAAAAILGFLVARVLRSGD